MKAVNETGRLFRCRFLRRGCFVIPPGVFGEADRERPAAASVPRKAPAELPFDLLLSAERRRPEQNHMLRTPMPSLRSVRRRLGKYISSTVHLSRCLYFLFPDVRRFRFPSSLRGASSTTSGRWGAFPTRGGIQPLRRPRRPPSAYFLTVQPAGVSGNSPLPGRQQPMPKNRT